MECHTAIANHSLGLEEGQLNRNLTYPSTGITANQLATADFIDVLTLDLPDSPSNRVQFAEPTNPAASLDERARAYLHSNCSGCHQPGGPTPSNMDLRYTTPFASTGTCRTLVTSMSRTLG